MESMKLSEVRDPVRDAIEHAESTPPEYLYWDFPYQLRRLRIRFGLKRWQLAALAGLSASVVGRVERGADLRLSTLKKLFGALGCRPVILPGGALYEMDVEDAYRDDGCIDWLAEVERLRRERELQRNAISPAPEQESSTKR